MMLWTEDMVSGCRVGFGGHPMLADRLRLWRRSKMVTVGGVIQRRPPESYIIPATDLEYYRRNVWYACGTTEQIIELLWMKRDPVSYHFDDNEDGA